MIGELQLQSNLGAVHEAIGGAALRAGRDPAEISVIAISKGQPAEAVALAYAAGHRLFGENRVEEAMPKIERVGDLPGLQWHMVGHIQSRKARLVPRSFSVVHSVDRLKIARKLNEHALAEGTVLPVCIECNVSGEATKYGWGFSDRDRWDLAHPEVEELSRLEGLRVIGLMTMAPWEVDEKIIRGVFRGLRELRDYLQDRCSMVLKELSMGMSDDYPIAIEEGATMVRIGRAIFGPRSE